MVGAVCADSLGYWLGRLGHTEWHRKMGWRHSHRVQKRADDLFERYGLLALFLGRLMWVIHPMVPMAAGAFGVGVLAFYLIDIVAVFLWLLLYLSGGHWLTVLWLQLTPGHRIWLSVALLLLIVIVVTFAYRKAESRMNRHLRQDP